MEACQASAASRRSRWAPIDLSQVEWHLLSEKEIQWLDAYHQQVREVLSPHVDSDARQWLLAATAPVREHKERAA